MVPRPQLAQPVDTSYRFIPLTQGRVSLVNVEDYERFKEFTWAAHQQRGRWYVIRGVEIADKQLRVQLHREIMKAPVGVLVDHINGDGLDNRRANLRLCNKSENGRNRGIQRNNKSGYRGVRFDSRRSLFVAYIQLPTGKQKYLGSFHDAASASRRYEEFASDLFGAFYRPLAQ